MLEIKEFSDWNYWLFAASLLSAGTAAVHFFAGGREIAAPLLAARDIGHIAKHTNYYCWHLVTITLVAMAVAFLQAAATSGNAAGVAIWAVLATAFALWNLALILWKRLNPWHMIQWALFLPIAGMALAGVWL